MSRTLTFVAVSALVAGTVQAALPQKADELKSHLEFLGYEITISDEVMRATHPTNLNVVLKGFRGGILVQSYLTASDYAKEHPTELMRFANTLNENATVARMYVDKDGDLALEAWFPGQYEKARFSLFLEEWHKDTIVTLRQQADQVRTLVE